MANTAGICTSFKAELPIEGHNLNSDSIKAALYLTTATVGPSTTAYSATNEVSSANYTAGGAAVTNGTVATSGTTAYWTPAANLSWSNVTITTDCALFYNTSNSNKAICSCTFSTQTVSAGNFTLTMPTNDASNALIRIN